MGIVTAFDGELPADVVELLQVAVGLSSGAHPPDGDHDVDVGLRAPGPLDGHARDAAPGVGRFERRTLVSRETIAAITAVAIAVVLVGSTVDSEGEVPREHVLLRRPARVHARTAGRDPVAAARAGPAATVPGAARRAAARRGGSAPGARRRASHRGDLRPRDGHARGRALRGARLAGARPRRLRAVRAGVSAGHARGRRPAQRAARRDVFRRILVPMKLGDIGEEMVATAVALAKESGAGVEAITVVEVPRDRRSTRPSLRRSRSQADASVAEARALGRGERRRRARGGRPRSLDRPRDRRRGDTSPRRPHRARLGTALAAPVAVLLAHGRPRSAHTRRARCSSSRSPTVSSRRRDGHAGSRG